MGYFKITDACIQASESMPLVSRYSMVTSSPAHTFTTEKASDFNDAPSAVVNVRGVAAGTCGPDFPIGLKYNGYEAVADGIDISLAKKIGQHMEEIGVDYLHVASMTFGLGRAEYPSVSPMYSKNGALIELAAEVKKGLKSIPVVGAGGINEPNLAERILKNKEVDMLALGRAFFADPSWVGKVRSKRISSIRPCIRCNICHLKLFQNQLLKCTVNPFFGWQGKQEAIDKASAARQNESRQ